MTSKKYLLLVFLFAALALIVAACGSTKATETPAAQAPAAGAAGTKEATAATPTSAPKPTATPEPTAEPEAELSLGDLIKAEELNSYRSSTTITYKGTKDAKDVEVSVVVASEYTREPLAHHIRMTTIDTREETGSGTIEIYQVGDTQYMNMQDQWFSMTVTDTKGIETQGLISGEDLMTDTCGWEKQGRETLDGVRVERWSLPKADIDKCFASLEFYDKGEITNAGGDAWIAVQGKYIAKMIVFIEGKGLTMFGADTDDPIVDEGRMEITYTMTDVNRPITIEVPEEAKKGSQLPEDIPTPADAQGVSQMFGMISFTSAMTPQEVADFYKAQMPANGWLQSKDESFGDFFTLEFTKGTRTASFMISADNTGKTSVLITVQGE